MPLMFRSMLNSAMNELSDDEPLPPGVIADDEAPPGVSASPPPIVDENSQYSLSDSLSEPDSDGPPGAWDDELPPGVEDVVPPPPPPPPPPQAYTPDSEMMEKLITARVKLEFVEIMKQMPLPKEAYEALAASPSPNLLFRELVKKGLMPMPPPEALADLPPLEMFDDLEGSIYRDGMSSLVRHLLPYCEEDISFLTKVPPNAVPLSEIASQVFGMKKETPRYQIRIPSPEYHPPPIEERVPTPPPPPEPIPESRSRVKKLLEQKRLELARRKAQMKMSASQILSLKNGIKMQDKEETRLPAPCEAKLDESSQESENGLSSRSQDSEVASPDMREYRSRHHVALKRSATPPRRVLKSPPMVRTKDRSSSSESSFEQRLAQKRPRDKIAMDKFTNEPRENGSSGSFSMKISQVNKGGMKDTLRKLSFGTEEEEEMERRELEKKELEEKKRKALEEEAERAQIKRERREARDRSKEFKKIKVEQEDRSPVRSRDRKPLSIKVEKEDVQVKILPWVQEEPPRASAPRPVPAPMPVPSPQEPSVSIKKEPLDMEPSLSLPPTEDPEAEEERRLLEQMLKTQAELEKLKQRRLQQLQCKPLISDEPVSSTQEKVADVETNAQAAQEEVMPTLKKEEEDGKKTAKKAKKKTKKLKKKQKKEKSETRTKTEKPPPEKPPAVAKPTELDLAAFRDDELDHITDRTFKRHLRVPICGIRYTLTEPSLKFSANLRHLIEFTQIVDRERPVESYVSQRLIENEVERMEMDMAPEMEVSPVKTHNLIRINTIDGPLPYSKEDFSSALDDFSVNYQGNLLEVPIVCAAESTSSGNSPPTIPSFASNAPQEQDSPESTTGPPKPCLSKTRRSNQPKSVSFFDGTVPEKDPLALSPPPPSQLLAERRKNRQRVSLLPPAATVNAHALSGQNLAPPPPPAGDAPVLYALDPINKQVYEILHPGNGIAITPGGVRSLDAQKYIYGEVVHTNETVLVENFLHLVYKFPYLINGEPE